MNTLILISSVLTSFRHTALGLTLGLLLSSVAFADDRWVKVYDPDSELKRSLPQGAIDYGNFVWMAESQWAELDGTGRAQTLANPFRLTIGEQRVDPLEGLPSSDDGWFDSPRHTEADFRIVQFNGPIKREWLNELRGRGIEPVQYLHPYSYIVWADAGAMGSSRSVSQVRWSGEFLPVMRVPEQSRQSSQTHAHSMALIHAGTKDRALHALQEANIEVSISAPLNNRFHLLQLVATPDQYQAIASIPGVFTVQQIGQDAGPRGEMSNQSVVGGYDEFNQIFPGYRSWLDPTGLDGSGVVVGIVDGGVRESHQDLVDNMLTCQGSNGSCGTTNDNHGSHVAGAVAGTGISDTTDANGFLRGQGVAPGASIVEQLYPPFLGGGPG
ncbi:MAG: S8 family serine peptidase, partial [Pseudomonadota bacterium]